MSRRLALGLLLVVQIAGCGGGGAGGNDDPALTVPRAASAQERAVGTWADAAQSYWARFRDCGSGANPVRGYFASCTKQGRRSLRQAERQALRRLGGPAAPCKRLRSLITRSGASLERAVTAFDASNDAGIARRPYRGAPPQSLYLNGERTLAEDVPLARRLSRDAPAAC
jgi:hypothetical protein